jgi:hypothetical protein
MSHELFTKNDFLLLRSDIDKALFELKKEPADKVHLPQEQGGDLSVKTVSAGELLLVTLSAMAKATRRLRESNVAIDMRSNPIEMKFTGTITDFSKRDNGIYIKLEN